MTQQAQEKHRQAAGSLHQSRTHGPSGRLELARWNSGPVARRAGGRICEANVVCWGTSHGDAGTAGRAVHPLSDGQGNPPPGWGNPYQQGTMTLLSPAEAVFRDHAGHQVQFQLRPGATTFAHLCS